jgi:hypothetical protein
MHKRILFLLVFQLTLVIGCCQQLSFKFGTPFRRTDLDVRWNVSSNELPAEVWVYRLLPHSFSPAAVSRLAGFGGFTDKDVVRSNASEIIFHGEPGCFLAISPRLGTIELYPNRPQYNTPHAATNVPSFSELPALTTNLMQALGISVVDIEKQPDGSPNLHLSQPKEIFRLNGVFVTNVSYRAVSFRRAIDGASFVGNGAGGDCYIQFGENGKPVKISLSWRDPERYKAYATASRDMITKWIRQGKAVQGRIRMDAEPIDWKTVKSVTITSTKLCYYGGNTDNPSNWLMPFVALWATVDRGHGTIDVEIDCPIIEP